VLHIKKIVKKLINTLPVNVKNTLIPNKGNINPSLDFLNYIQLAKSNKKIPLRIAEIGVDKGSSSMKALEILDNADTLDLYDRSSCEFFINIENIKTDVNLNIFSCTDKEYDSYFWEIARLYKKNPVKEIYDVIYLDGAHVYTIDGPTLPLLIQMMKPGGYLILDDIDWTLAKSPTCNTKENRAKFSTEQMKTPHMALLEELFLENNKEFIKLKNLDTNHLRSIYQKLRID